MARVPVMLELGDRRCVVVGGGPVGVKRARVLHDAGAEVVVVSPSGSESLDQLIDRGVVWVERAFEAADLDGALLAVAATSDTAVNESVAAAAVERGVLVNRADDASAGGLTFMASGQREGVTVAVDSGGASAAAAGRLRDLALDGVGEDWPRLLRLARPWRERVKASIADPEPRSEVLRRLTGQEAMDILQTEGESRLEAYWTGLIGPV
ncbi:MAG: bifunctional precorrin-2 dehydrogenase/sirohydrochlorin ferrochelatase [Planctomycetota bacterium]